MNKSSSFDVFHNNISDNKIGNPTKDGVKFFL